jgi:hypothetical protein
VGTSVPIWPFVAAGAAITAALWISLKRRFSLQTLLIATTLVAVGLGVIVAF